MAEQLEFGFMREKDAKDKCVNIGDYQKDQSGVKDTGPLGGLSGGVTENQGSGQDFMRFIENLRAEKDCIGALGLAATPVGIIDIQQKYGLSKMQLYIEYVLTEAGLNDIEFSEADYAVIERNIDPNFLQAAFKMMEFNRYCSEMSVMDEFLESEVLPDPVDEKDNNRGYCEHPWVR